MGQSNKKNYLLLLVVLFTLFVAGLWISTPTSNSTNQVQVVYDKINVDAAVARLSKALQYQTVSSPGFEQQAATDFPSLLQHIESSFPLIYEQLTVENIADRSLLIHWQGMDKALNPSMLIAHLDVVPVSLNAKTSWSHPPFSGTVDEQFIWGRGALDDKSAVMGILEAVEFQLTRNYQPKRSIYIALTHDEESGGKVGAANIAKLLSERAVKLEFVIDEGQAITQGVIPGVTGPVAMVGVTQKGYMSVELMAKGEGGHSSMPPKATAIAQLSEAIHHLTENPMPAVMSHPVKVMFGRLASEMDFPANVLLTHLWLTEPLVKKQLSMSSASDALLRTSMSVNMIKGGVAENVLPQSASAVINFRIAAHDSSESVLNYIQKNIKNDNISVSVVSAVEEPAPITAIDLPGFKAMEKTLLQTFPEALIVPGITLASTDSKHFYSLTDQILRFSPIRVSSADLQRIHGVDERLSINNYREMIQFYINLFSNL